MITPGARATGLGFRLARRVSGHSESFFAVPASQSSEPLLERGDNRIYMHVAYDLARETSKLISKRSEYTPDELRDWLYPLPNVRIVLRCDRVAPWQRVLDLLTLLAEASVDREVLFEIEPPRP